MGCGYMGCGTPQNKILWAVFAALLALAAVMFGVGVGKTIPCTRALMACNRDNPEVTVTVRQNQQFRSEHDRNHTNVCSTQFRQCGRTHIIVAGAGVLAAAIAASLLCCMCCCSKHPAKANTAQPYANMAVPGMYQMQGYPTAVPTGQQQQYTYSPYSAQQGPPGYPQQVQMAPARY